MANMFQNAYFSKLYKTRDGRKAVYLGDNTCWIEGCATEIRYSRNGLFVDFQQHAIDIVSEWHEEINEEELDKIAWDYIESQDMPCRYEETAIEAFKAGYRKALKQ